MNVESRGNELMSTTIDKLEKARAARAENAAKSEAVAIARANAKAHFVAQKAASVAVAGGAGGGAAPAWLKAVDPLAAASTGDAAMAAVDELASVIGPAEKPAHWDAPTALNTPR
jgi:hypothetical protein